MTQHKKVILKKEYFYAGQHYTHRDKKVLAKQRSLLVLLKVSLAMTILFSVVNCSTTVNPPSKQSKNKMKKIRYIDQNNNSYTIEPSSIYYSPITPKESSSGTYSGGEKANKTIDQKTFESVLAKVNAIVENKSLHLSQRRMMTAILYVYKEENYEKYTIGRSKERTELEELLKTILGKI